MDFRLLVPYSGLLDRPRTWGQPDDKGQLPRARLRDYIALFIIVVLCLPIPLRFLANSWASHQRKTREDRSRQEEIMPGYAPLTVTLP